MADEPIEPASCGNCRYFVESSIEDLGFCRRRAPTPIWPVSCEANEDETCAIWPKVHILFWCGEWEPAK